MRQSGSGGNRGIAVVELALALAAIGALTMTVLRDLPVHASPYAASDLKTLYASASCMRHGQSAYDFANLQRVFQAQGIAPPPSWYGHAPVYPPMTVAMLVPLTFLSMAQAAYLMTAVYALLMVCAVCAVLRYGEETFGLTLGWKAVIVAMFAMAPLLAFGLSVGNPSIPAAALCMLAFVRRSRGWVWGSAIALGLALLLKPHLALWMLVAMALLPERRGRAVAWRGAVVAFVAGGLALLAVAGGHAGMQMTGCLHMVRAEVAPGGSMNVGSHEPLFVASQITSLESVLGFWSTSALAVVATVMVLVAVAAVLVWETRRGMGERRALLAAGAWCALGLLTTYHRAHDATLLLVLAPWVVDRLRRDARSWQPWAVLAIYAAMSVGPQWESVRAAADEGRSLLGFAVMRQAGLADMALLAVLLATMMVESRRAVTIRLEPFRVPQSGSAYQKAVRTVTPSEVTATTSQ